MAGNTGETSWMVGFSLTKFNFHIKNFINQHSGNPFTLDYLHTHLAGDGSFKKKKFKEFCQFRLNLLIKISYIPDFEFLIQGFKSYIFFAFFSKKYFFFSYFPKIGKNNRGL